MAACTQRSSCPLVINYYTLSSDANLGCLWYKMLVEFLDNLGILLFVATRECERFEYMFCLFPHSVDKGIYLKNFIFLAKFRSAPKLLESLLPLQPLLGLCEVKFLRRVEFQHFVFLLLDRCHHVKLMLHMNTQLNRNNII